MQTEKHYISFSIVVAEMTEIERGIWRINESEEMISTEM